MAGEVMGYKIIQNEDDNSVVVYKDNKPFIRAVLTRSLTSFQMAGYWPMIKSAFFFYKKRRKIHVLTFLHT